MFVDDGSSLLATSWLLRVGVSGDVSSVARFSVASALVSQRNGCPLLALGPASGRWQYRERRSLAAASALT